LDAVLLFYDNNKAKPRQHLKEIHIVNNDEDAVVTTIVIITSLLEGGVQEAIHTAENKYKTIITKVVSSNLMHGKVYSIQYNVIFVSDLRQVCGFLQAF
jgi:hypothetical protein